MDLTELPERDLYWIAGLLEGEGSFQPPRPSSPNRPEITINMTDLDVMERFAKLVGENYIHMGTKNVRRNPAWKPDYRVHIRGEKAVQLMRLLRPLMGSRRQAQIDKALVAYQGSRRSHLGLASPVVVEAFRRARSGENMNTIAADLGIGYHTVYDIKRGRTWRHVTDPIGVE